MIWKNCPSGSYLPFSGLQVTTQTAIIQSVLQKIETTYAPDKRVIVFDVSLQENENRSGSKEVKFPNLKFTTSWLQKLRNLPRNTWNSIRLLPDKSFGENQWGIVPLSAIYISKAPDFWSGNHYSGTDGHHRWKFWKEKGGWLRIQTPDRYIGWTSTDDIERINRKQLNEYNQLQKVIVTSHHTFVLKNPNKNSEIITEAIMGNLMVVNEMKQGKKYWSVTLPDGKTGYVRKRRYPSVSTREINLSANSIIKLGKSFMGLPYFWGGTTSRGMDCSQVSPNWFSLCRNYTSAWCFSTIL